MGDLLHTFTIDRNTFKRTAEVSADSVAAHIDKVKRSEILDKTASNIVGALASYMGIFVKESDSFVPTALADVFLRQYSADKADSWRWLVARSLWRFVLPNGTASKANGPAREQGVTIAFFHTILQLLTHLSALPNNERFLYFEELCKLLDDDANWKLPAAQLLTKVMAGRASSDSGFASQRSLLGDLENTSDTVTSEFDIPRDNLSGLFLKAFKQTAFFDFLEAESGKEVAIALGCDLDPVLQRRTRFILDHPPTWNGTDWGKYMDLQPVDLPEEVSTAPTLDASHEPADLSGLVEAAVTDLATAGLTFSRPQVLRFVSSLLAKRFLILTGLSGSGKTMLALAFARWLCPSISQEGDVAAGQNPPASHYAIVPVGADWIGNENVLGYPNGLDATAYVAKPALELFLRAIDKPETPHFLILDEMNLSHVERYFADMLSAIESGEAIPLHFDEERKANGRTVPRSLTLPKNVFIVGTVNVDETTYMFSPKVLDRANVIEFRMDANDFGSYLAQPLKADISKLDGKGASFGNGFVAAAADSADIPASVKEMFDKELMLFFHTLQRHGAEFGYRVGHESGRFIRFYEMLGGYTAEDSSWFRTAFDCLVVQKLLPKLHGSRAKLGPLLRSLWLLCADRTRGRSEDALDVIIAAERSAEPSSSPPAGSMYPVSASKIARLWRTLNDNGFASFAEA